MAGTGTQVFEREKVINRVAPLWNVVLLDDDHHTYEYVIEMMQELFGYPAAKGYDIACEVDSTGRVICATLPLEHAEVKRDQIHAYGHDYRLASCLGSMTAVLEQAM